MNKPADPAFLTPRDAAHLLNLPTYTVLRMIRRKELPALKVGSHWRIPRLHVAAAEIRLRER